MKYLIKKEKHRINLENLTKIGGNQMINNVTLVGRLTKDPEMKYTKSGVAVVSFTLAVNRTFTNQKGEQQADFISCLAWRKTAVNLADFQRKGNLVGVVGRIQTSNYEGADGKRVYKTEVVAENIHFLESRKNGNTSVTASTNNAQAYNNNMTNQTPPPDPFASQEPFNISPDDLPF